MAFLKSRRGAVVVTVLVILFSVVFGAHRSLTSLRSDALEVFETGAYGDGHSVKGDLEARRATCDNLYTVASRYLPADNANLTDLKSNLDALSADVTDPFAQADLAVVAELVLDTLADEALSEQDAKYVSGFTAELQSRTLSIAKDPYNAQALDFNNHVLGTFPANLLRHVAFVSPLPTYR